jgi:hypothetical protein
VEEKSQQIPLLNQPQNPTAASGKQQTATKKPQITRKNREFGKTIKA